MIFNTNPYGGMNARKKYTSFLEVMCMKLIYNQPIRLINETSRLL
jgi:hypothetical protein